MLSRPAVDPATTPAGGPHPPRPGSGALAPPDSSTHRSDTRTESARTGAAGVARPPRHTGDSASLAQPVGGFQRCSWMIAWTVDSESPNCLPSSRYPYPRTPFRYIRRNRRTSVHVIRRVGVIARP